MSLSFSFSKVWEDSDCERGDTRPDSVDVSDDAIALSEASSLLSIMRQQTLELKRDIEYSRHCCRTSMKNNSTIRQHNGTTAVSYRVGIRSVRDDARNNTHADASWGEESKRQIRLAQSVSVCDGWSW